MTASFCMYPYEVIRNGQQSSRNYKEEKLGILKLTKEIYTKRGKYGFYYGFRINLIRILPNTAIMFCAYEYLSRYLFNLINIRM